MDKGQESRDKGGWWKRMKCFLRTNSSVTVIVVAVLLVEFLSGAQYYYTHNLMEDELEKRAEMELTMKAILTKGIIESSEHSLKGHIFEVKKTLDNPDSLSVMMAWFLKYSPHLKGSGIAFKPGYYTDRAPLFEPYALRTESGIQCLQVAGEQLDYTKDGFYRYIQEKKTNNWVGPYDDVYLKMKIISYAVPLYEFSGDTVGVFGIDIDTHFLGDTLNNQHIYPSSFDVLLTEDGRLIAGPTAPDMQKKVEDMISVINDSTIKKSWIKNRTVRTASYYDKEAGKQLSVFFANMRGQPHWQIAVVCYDDEVYAPLIKLRFRLLLFSLLAFGILLFIVRNFARNAEKLKQKTIEEERISSELRVASQIQQSMLPAGHLQRDDVEICGLQVPARDVGGDLFDYYIRDEKLFFCIGDVSGKGAASAMLMGVVHSLFRAFSDHENNPARILRAINLASCTGNESNMFVTMFIGVLDLPTGRLRYSDAGHDAPWTIDNSVAHDTTGDSPHAQWSMLDAIPHLPVGVFEDVNYGVQEIQFYPQAEDGGGSTIFLYSDGLTEAMDKDRKQFGLKRVEEVLAACKDKPIQEILGEMTDAVHRFVKDAEQSDDLTMMAIRYTPKTFESRLSETLTIKNDVHEVTRLGDFIKLATDELHIGMSKASQLRLAVEEAVVNVIDYAYPEGTQGDIEIRMMSDGDTIRFQIIDSGVAFDPTAKERADTTLSAEDRRIGGLGILLVREMMDAINYERQDGKNVLTLIKKLS